ncbi:pmpB, partial [Symbiodinium pilosum]
VCDPGNTQTINGTNRSCSQCPDGARECFAGHLVMERGMMVQNDFVNQTLHCPNQAACPGGRLPQSPDGKAMCVDGYEGQGCTSCSVGYAIADSSVLT